MSTQMIDKGSNTEQQQTAQQHHRKMAATKIVEQIGIRLFLIAMSVLFLIPLYWMFVTALKPAKELSAFPPTIWPAEVHWENFAVAVSTIPFGQYFFNTTVITVLTILGSVLSNLVVAYGFACIKWPGRDIVFTLVIATLFIPFPIAVVPLFDMFAWLKWINTYLPLTVPHFFGSAFFIFMLRQFLLQIPQETLEAARIDGASELQILFRIVLPMSTPALAAVSIFAAIGAWNDFIGPLIYLQDDTVRTLSIGLQVFRTTNDIQFNLLMAASVLIVLPVIVLFLAFQRFFIKGVTIGSIK